MLQAYGFLQHLAAIRVILLSLLGRREQLASRKSRFEAECGLIAEAKLVTIAEQNCLVPRYRCSHTQDTDFAEPFHSIIGPILGVDKRLNVCIIANRVDSKMHVGNRRVWEVDMTTLSLMRQPHRVCPMYHEGLQRPIKKSSFSYIS